MGILGVETIAFSRTIYDYVKAAEGFVQGYVSIVWGYRASAGVMQGLCRENVGVIWGSCGGHIRIMWEQSCVGFKDIIPQ